MEFIIGYNFLDGSDTCDDVDSQYPLTNLKDYWHPKRQFRTATTLGCSIVRDLGGVKSIYGVFLNDVNFGTFALEHSVDGINWVSLGSKAITIDERTNKYKALIVTDIDCRYIQITIPSQTTYDGTNAFKVGSFIILGSIIQVNPSYPYEYTVEEPIKRLQFDGGFTEQIKLGDYIFNCSLNFDPYAKDSEHILWSLNSISQTMPIVLFENSGVTNKAYLCSRHTAIEVSWAVANVVKTNKINYKEIV